MKRKMLLSLCFAIALCGNAQINYNSIDFGRMANQTMTNMINTMGHNILANNTYYRLEVERAGIEKMKAGKASNTVASAKETTEALAKNMTWDAGEPTDVAGQTARVQAFVAGFEDRIKSAGLTPKEYGDGWLYSWALSYEVVYNRPVSKEEIAEKQQSNREQLLNDPYFQGLPDKDKQTEYESRALMAHQAADLYEKSKTATGAAKEEQQKKARHYARYALGDEAVDVVEKGLSVIKEGKAVTTFSGNGKLSIDKDYLGAEYAARVKENDLSLADLLAQFNKKVEAAGGSTDDLAWCNAVAFACAYEVYTAGEETLNRDQLRWVLKEMEHDLLASGYAQGVDDEQRQKNYEYIALQSMVLHALWKKGVVPNKELKKKAYLKLKDIFTPRNFDEYSLTPTGFEKNKQRAKPLFESSTPGAKLAVPVAGALLALGAGAFWWRRKSARRKAA